MRSLFSLVAVLLAVTASSSLAADKQTGNPRHGHTRVSVVIRSADDAEHSTSIITEAGVPLRDVGVVRAASNAAATTPAPTTPKPVVSNTAKPTTAAPYTPHPEVPTLPNWVGPKVGAPSDTACYRKTHLTKKCPPGFEFDKIATCWAECPIEYPVECGMECIPQNKDCALEVIGKINAAATVALNAATLGVFGQLTKASKLVQTGVKCGQQLFSVVGNIVDYVKELEEGGLPNTTQSQVQAALSNSDFVVIDLPIAITTCLGLPAPTGLEQKAEVVAMVKKILELATSMRDELLDTDAFLTFTESVGVGSSVKALNASDKDVLTKLMESGDTCGSELKGIVDRVTVAVKQIKVKAPSSSVEEIRFALSNTDLFLKDIPAATSNCIPKNADGGFATRDDIRKTFQVIIDQIIDSSSSKEDDKPLSTAEYALKVADMGLDVISIFDPTGLADLAKEFIQPICGPTSFLGEIDDGAADKALGLRTIGKAFASSSGAWKKSGSGNVTISFVSVDKHDVVVNVISGGNKIDEVKVPKGKTASWTKRIADLKDKTLYLDRWRPGLFGIPGTGGGSLLLWVPHSSTGGHLELRAQLNVS